MVAAASGPVYTQRIYRTRTLVLGPPMMETRAYSIRYNRRSRPRATHGNRCPFGYQRIDKRSDTNRDRASRNRWRSTSETLSGRVFSLRDGRANTFLAQHMPFPPDRRSFFRQREKYYIITRAKRNNIHLVNILTFLRYRDTSRATEIAVFLLINIINACTCVCVYSRLL